MSIVSIRLPEKLLRELDDCAQALHIPRAKYIREAIERMNEEVTKQERKRRLTQASLKVRKESMRVKAEFDEIEHDSET